MRAAGDRAIARIQGAIRLSQTTEPQPDVALLKPRADFYRHAHPTGTDTLLVIEVSDSTLRYDRDVKVPLYARHGVPEVWIVDLQHGRLLVYGSPADGEYRRHESIERAGLTPLAALPDVSIDLSALFEP